MSTVNGGGWGQRGRGVGELVFVRYVKIKTNRMKFNGNLSTGTDARVWIKSVRPCGCSVYVHGRGGGGWGRGLKQVEY